VIPRGLVSPFISSTKRRTLTRRGERRRRQRGQRFTLMHVVYSSRPYLAPQFRGGCVRGWINAVSSARFAQRGVGRTFEKNRRVRTRVDKVETVALVSLRTTRGVPLDDKVVQTSSNIKVTSNSEHFCVVLLVKWRGSIRVLH